MAHVLIEMKNGSEYISFSAADQPTGMTGDEVRTTHLKTREEIEEKKKKKKKYDELRLSVVRACVRLFGCARVTS